MRRVTWRLVVLPTEVHIRLPRRPGLRLDVTRSEAADLLEELSKALAAPLSKPYRVPWHLRLRDWWLLALWRLSPQAKLERQRLAEDAKRMLNGGGW